MISRSMFNRNIIVIISLFALLMAPFPAYSVRAGSLSSANPTISNNSSPDEINTTATFTVNSFLDQPDDLTIPGTCHTAANTCTLRAAIMQANRSSGAGATIIVPAGLYLLTIPAAGGDGEENGDLVLTKPVGGNPSISIIGSGTAATVIDANQLGRSFHVLLGRHASISNLTIRNGFSVGADLGSGIYNQGVLDVNSVSISGNTSSYSGGGIYNAGTLRVTNSSIINNQSTIKHGGGIYNIGALTVTNSTISQNTAAGNGGGIFSYQLLNVFNSTIDGNFAGNSGGGLYISNSTILVNSTIAQNNAAADGGGIYNIAGAANVYNTSITFNGADSDSNSLGNAGGVFNDDANLGVFNMRNTLVAGNYIATLIVTDDCSGTLNAYGLNLFYYVNGCTINTAHGNWATLNSLYLLGPLQNNGGSTKTHALLVGSNAIDGGDPVLGCVGPDSLPLVTDQRGMVRVSGVRCDIGSYEADQVAPVVVSSLRLDANPSIAASLRFTVNFSESVVGVDVSDFALVVSGLSGAAITSVSGSGLSRIVTASTGTGFGTLQLTVKDNDSILDADNNPLGGAGAGNGNFLSGQKYTMDRNNKFTSAAAIDGWVLENKETGGLGGTRNAAGTLQVGDDAVNKQYRSFLYFNTAGLPENAVIVKVTLRIKTIGVVGTNPFKTHGALLADIKKGYFGTSSGLQTADFQAPSSKNKSGTFLPLSAAPGWFQLVLNPAYHQYINKAGATQFRLRFTLDDNNDKSADFARIYSGDGVAAYRPVLVVEYTLP